MRLTLAATIACLFPLTAVADELCLVRSEMARSVMDARLSGVPLDRALASVESAKGPASIKADMRNLTIAAYKSPGYQTAAAKQRAITEFGNQALISCLEAM